MSEGSPSDRLAPDLIDRVEALTVPELRALGALVEDRLAGSNDDLETMIRESAAGEIVDIDLENDASALVHKHPPAPDGSGVNEDTVSLYRVRRQPRFEGGEELRWAYLGDAADAHGPHCPDCGHPLPDDLTTCPHCGREVSDS
ncbi:zinc ribbon domain-containing protein [Halococcoides cellulosivorans]|uniref:Zinc ribbon domain-containing protein n=1 Tax=Halococcoides cellulosivorans TaxID=1679096 RepID=A0A2R4WZR7_9EURY|nr:zinc ribbon domain-containing protein [Halococcoides cellulosivorans]AWB27024.1 zinc ribbon domain-containing protein [Halococcoides cellulosivorans]